MKILLKKRQVFSFIEKILLLLIVLLLVACGGQSGDTTGNDEATPIANAGADQAVFAGHQVTLLGSGSVGGTGEITFAWTQLGGAEVELSGATTSNPTFTAPLSPGTLTFRLTVTNSHSALHSDEVVVQVNNIPPIANSG